ncbi:hypothetical protein MesoLjLc_08680 [Mesorhizobium sp. L-8-10]|nr:hypothetical protein MesoLjLc_08680 [Mesorhizobium sp. L-8-10]
MRRSSVPSGAKRAMAARWTSALQRNPSLSIVAPSRGRAHIGEIDEGRAVREIAAIVAAITPDDPRGAVGQIEEAAVRRKAWTVRNADPGI